MKSFWIPFSTSAETDWIKGLQVPLKQFPETLSFLWQNKDDEIVMLRGLVRQQEDATRLLGERMRNEAQEHVSLQKDCNLKT